MTIDWWTLGIQTVNVVILVWLLGRFFWRPVAAMIEQRRAAAQTILAEAEAKRSRGGRRARRDRADARRLRAGTRGDPRRRPRSRRARASRAAGGGREGGGGAAKPPRRRRSRRRRTAADKAWAERASRLAVDIAGRLAARLDGPAVRAAFLDWLLKEIRALAGHGAAGRGGDRRSTRSDQRDAARCRPSRSAAAS